MRSTGPFPLKRGSNTIFGSDPSCDWELPSHLRLADRHVSISMSNDGARARLQDLGAGTNVNGRWVIGRSVEICENDEIDIGPYAMRFTGLQLESVGSMSSSQLTVRRVSLTGSRDGKPMPLLQQVEIVLVPRDFACILGPSGCGKSTLMKVMSGRSHPDANGGSVYLNHRDLHARFEQVKHGLVLVPQKPVLHGELTVREALRYTARLRLPSSVNAAERVEHLIAQVGLGDSASKPVKVISGGQEKRLCLANELMSDPGLIFLDEVTSGLDELSDRKMMQLFRGLADSGKTVACITHSLANVGKYCNLLVVLGPGGCLAFVGKPAEAIEYFKVNELCDIYGVFDVACTDPVERIRLQLEKSKQLAAGFMKSENYQKYVKSRLPAEAPPAVNRAIQFTRNIFSEVKISAWQTGILTIRSLKILSRDLATVASLVLQLVLVALILTLGFGVFEKIPEWKDREREEYQNYSNRQTKEEGEKKDDNSYIITAATHRRMDYVRKLLNLTFLLGVTSFWFGCNNAAKEIVREKLISTQERMFNSKTIRLLLVKVIDFGHG